jgi:hypothetical protein
MRRGLAGAVDARHHDHGGGVLANHQRLFQRAQQVGQGVGQQALDGGGSVVLVLHAALEIGHQQELRWP